MTSPFIDSPQPASDSALHIKLHGESLLEVLEPVLRSGADAHLNIKLGRHAADIYVHEGRVVHAESTCFASKEAAYNLIAWRNGELTINKDVPPPQETVNIAWIDFLRFYEEEVEKVALAFLPQIEGGLYLKLLNPRGRQVYLLDRLASPTAQQDLAALLDPKALAEITPGLRAGTTAVAQRTAGHHMLLIKYLVELRSFVLAAFAGSRTPQAYESWLHGVFEPRALDAVSVALHKADAKDVRGVILVIDDSPTTRAILEDTLTSYRFEVHTAEDGYEGLVKMQEVHPDLVFLDVMMPKLDGYQVLKKIRAIPGLWEIPVVMLSTQDMAEDKGAAFQEGAAMYIEKPFTTKKILAIVENVLGLE